MDYIDVKEFPALREKSKNEGKNAFNFKLLSIMIALVFGIVFLEISSRIIMPRPLYNPKIDLSKKEVWNSNGVILWKVNQHFNDEILDDFKKKDGKFRIVALGDSIMNGSNVSPGKTYISILRNTLEKESKNVKILDLSIPGYNFIQEASLLLEVDDELEPDLIIIHSWEDDDSQYNIVGKQVYGMESLSMDGFVHVIPLPNKINQFLIINSRLYQLISFQIMKRKYNEQKNKADNDKIINEMYNDLVWKVGGDGRKILFLLSPRLDLGPISPFDSSTKLPLFYMTILEISKKHNSRIIDLGDLLKGINGSEIGVDRCHFNELGHNILADKLYEYIPSFVDENKKGEEK